MKFTFLFLIGAVCINSSFAADWSQWRGGNRDGHAELSIANWPESLTEEWQIEVGEGHSSPIISSGVVYQHARQNDLEVVRAIRLKDGTIVWKKSHAAPFKMISVARNHGKGPKSTPVASSGKLVTFGINGVLSCYDAASGDLVWRFDPADKFPKNYPAFGTAMSPIVVGESVVAHVGGSGKGALTAFNLETGNVVWEFDGDGPAYASPILIKHSGTEQLVTQTQKLIVGVDAQSGRKLWELPFTTSYDQNSVTPVSVGSQIICSGLKQPTFSVALEKSGNDWTPSTTWSNPDAPQYMSTSVSVGDRLFGMAQRRSGQVFCMNSQTGDIQWSNKGRFGKNASLIVAGDHVLVLSESGELVILRHDASEFEPVATYKVSDSPVWAYPAIAGNRILIKNATALTCFRIGD